MDGPGDLEQRKAMLDAAERGLGLLGEKAVIEEWPADERAALADERDTVADENDVVAGALDGRADRRDFDAALRQAETDLRTKNGTTTEPPVDTSSSVPTWRPWTARARWPTARVQPPTGSDPRPTGRLLPVRAGGLPTTVTRPEPSGRRS